MSESLRMNRFQHGRHGKHDFNKYSQDKKAQT